MVVADYSSGVVERLDTLGNPAADILVGGGILAEGGQPGGSLVGGSLAAGTLVADGRPVDGLLEGNLVEDNLAEDRRLEGLRPENVRPWVKNVEHREEESSLGIYILSYLVGSLWRVTRVILQVGSNSWVVTLSLLRRKSFES